MSLPQNLQDIFDNKQASYKMVLILSLLDSVDDTGQAPLEKVIENFRSFYMNRANEGKVVEAPDRDVYDIKSLTFAKAKQIIKTPIQALNDILEISSVGGKDYLRFKQRIWEMLDDTQKEELLHLTYDELESYYESIKPVFSLRDAFQKVMDEYPEAKSSPFAGHPLGEWMRVKVPEGIGSLPFVDHRYKVQGSVGQGNWATIPWIAIMDKNETETTQDGVYVVYLFAEDMRTVYLTLNQGVTRPIKEKGKKEGYLYLQHRVEEIRSLLSLERMVKKNDLYLTEKGLGSVYQVSTIAYIKYERDNLPGHDQLVSDLQYVMDNYRLYLDHKKSNYNQRSNYPSEKTVIIKEESELQYSDSQVGEILSHIKSFINSKGFFYPEKTIENFYLALKTKPFVILAGISGTGKTKLVELFAESIGATEENGRFKLIPVRPDWSDPSDLLGYVNLQGVFQPGPLTKVLMDALRLENKDKPYFVCLDEMNLARVEHYFSDLLSVMETRKWEDGAHQTIVTHRLLDATPKADQGGIPHNLFIPDNVYIIGTVNMDETTHPFSKKVLDRANTIELNDVDLKASLSYYLQQLENVGGNKVKEFPNSLLKAEYLLLKDAYSKVNETLIERIVEKLGTINNLLAEAHLQIGFRIRDEILFYMLYNDRFKLMSEDEAFDIQVLQKILPRIQGSSMTIKRCLVELFNWLGKVNLSFQDHGLYEEMKQVVETNPRYPRSLNKLRTMIERFEEDGFTSFWMA